MYLSNLKLERKMRTKELHVALEALHSDIAQVATDASARALEEVGITLEEDFEDELKSFIGSRIGGYITTIPKE